MDEWLFYDRVELLNDEVALPNCEILNEKVFNSLWFAKIHG